MTTVTYKKQSGIHATRGAVPIEGTKHIYRVSGILWPADIEQWIAERLIGKTLHVCCGKSQLGDVRGDRYEDAVDVRLDAARLPFADDSFDTVLIDPPYSGRFQWNHDMLNELHRIASKRIIFQHWFCPANKDGQFKKAHVFHLSAAVMCPVLPKTASIQTVFQDDDGVLYQVVEDQHSDPFILSDLVFWNPRTYFGRVQLISVFDHE